MGQIADDIIDVTWVAWAAERLREQWPRADPTALEETASEQWANEELRVWGPRQAVERWLRRGMPERLSAAFDATPRAFGAKGSGAS